MVEIKDELQIVMKESDILKKKEFVDYFEKVLRVIIEIRQKTERFILSMKELHEQMMHKIDSGLMEVKEKAMKYCMAEMSKMYKEHEKKMYEMDEKMESLKDGKDADEEKIVQDVLAQIKLPEQKDVILDNAEQIRGKLESLKGEDRLDKESIRGLDEEFKGIRESMAGIARGRNMGRVKVPMPRTIDLTSQQNGSARTFTIQPDTVRIFGGISSQFPFAISSSDISRDGNQITLNDTIAPRETGQTLLIFTDALFYP